MSGGSAVVLSLAGFVAVVVVTGLLGGETDRLRRLPGRDLALLLGPFAPAGLAVALAPAVQHALQRTPIAGLGGVAVLVAFSFLELLGGVRILVRRDAPSLYIGALLLLQLALTAWAGVHLVRPLGTN